MADSPGRANTPISGAAAENHQLNASSLAPRTDIQRGQLNIYPGPDLDAATYDPARPGGTGRLADQVPAPCECPVCGATTSPARAAFLLRAIGDPALKPITWSAAAEKLKAYYTPPLAAPRTWYVHQSVLRDIERFAASPAEVTPATIAQTKALFAARGYATDTIKSRLSALRADIHRLIDEQHVDAMMFATTRRRKDLWTVKRLKPAKVRAFSAAELAAVFAIADREYAEASAIVAAEGGFHAARERWRRGRRRALLYVVAYCGVRVSEALHLRWADVDSRSGILRVGEAEGFRAKTCGSVAPVAVPDEAIAILQEWQQVQPHGAWLFRQWGADKPWLHGCQGQNPLGQIKALGKRAGVLDLTLKGLRHSWATHAEALGLSAIQIQRQLRHDDIKTQRGYRHADEAAMRAAIRTLSFRA